MKFKPLLLLLYFLFYSLSSISQLPSSYNEYLKQKQVSKEYSETLKQLLEEGHYAEIMAFSDTISYKDAPYCNKYYYVTLANARQGSVDKALTAAYLHLSLYSPTIPGTFRQENNGMTSLLPTLQAYLPAAKETYQQRYCPLRDPHLVTELKEMQELDQLERRPLTPKQKAYDSINAVKLKSMVIERACWLERHFLRNEISPISVMVLHFSEEYKYFFLPYIYEDAELGLASWYTAESIIWRLMLDNNAILGYYKLHGLSIDDTGSLDIDKSRIGLQVSNSYTQGKNPITIHSTNHLDQKYADSILEQLETYYISQGVASSRIFISNEVIQVADAPYEPTCYAVIKTNCDGTCTLYW